MSFRITRRTPDGLNQGCLGTQEAFLIRIQNRHQRNLRNIQTLTQQIDSHQYIKHIQTHVPDDLRPLQRVDIRMQVLHTNSYIAHISCQVFRHPLGQRRHQNLMMACHFLVDLRDQIIDLSFHRPHIHFRIQQAGRPDDLLRAEQFMGRLIIRGRCRHKQHLIDVLLKLAEVQRPVVQRRRQPESVVHQCILPRSVSRVHSPDLRNRHMGLVYNNKEVILKVIHQGKRRLTFRHAVEVAGIVLNTGAEPGLPQHLDIKIRPLRDALRLQKLVLSLKIFHPLRQFLLNLYAGNINLLLRYDIVRCRIDHHMLQRGMYLSRQRIRLRDPVYLIPEKLNTDQMLAALCRIDFHHITTHPEATAVQIHIIAIVLHLDQSPDHVVAIPLHTGPQRHTHTCIFLRASQTIDTGHTGHHYNIPPLRQ